MRKRMRAAGTSAALSKGRDLNAGDDLAGDSTIPNAGIAGTDSDDATAS